MSDGTARRIAVIAIHGVGDHLPEEMAKAAGSMLQSRRIAGSDTESRYHAFSENLVRIRIGPVKLSSPPVRSAPAKGAWGPLDSLRLSGRTVVPAAAAKKDSIDHLFMEGQLEDYAGQGPEDSCEFLRLDGVRKAGAGIEEKQVHVYDMFWSDLSGVGTAGLRIFGELYQLLFHLGSVGVNNVFAAAAFFRGKKGVEEKWDAFSRAQKFVAGMLALPIPFLNLILLAFAVALFTTAAIAKLTLHEQSTVAAVGVIAVLAAGWAWLLLQRSSFSGTSYRAPLIFGLVGGAAGALVAIKSSESPEIAQGVVAAMALAASLFGAAAIASAYEKGRPGARLAFWWTLGGVVASTAVSLIFSTPWVADYTAMAILLRGGEVGFWWLVIMWSVFWLGMIRAWISGWLAVKATSGISSEKDRASRTNWTARLTIGVSATAFLLVSFAAWSGLLNAALPLLPADPTAPLYYSPLWGRTEHTQLARVWADEAFYDAGAGFMPVLLGLAAIAALIALYAVVPSVAGEVSPPDGADPHDSAALGNWLEQGFRFMRWAGRFLYAGVFLFPPVMAIVLLAIRADAGWVKVYMEETAPFAKTMGVLVAGGAAGLLAFSGRLSKLALGLRTGVRVALDVDNWLRELPHGTNPTARICARYVSLLRHVAGWRNEHHEGYDALVIFAHSQGTVITADLLRFLRAEANAAGGYGRYDPSLERLSEMKIYLFTVGCPLQQLYGLRFPYIYGYAHRDASGCPPPEPLDLGLALWTNAYRTGDYIGRSLWRPDNQWTPSAPISSAAWNPPAAIPANVFVDRHRAEFAVGPGAHTHYWDQTADQVAEALDAIIARA